VFVRDVGSGCAAFGQVRGAGACGAEVCLGLCERVEHCALGLVRSRRLLARYRVVLNLRGEKINRSEGGKDNGKNY
jgi:hypothetical protein